MLGALLVITSAGIIVWSNRAKLIASAPTNSTFPYSIVTERTRAWEEGRTANNAIAGVVFGDSVLKEHFTSAVAKTLASQRSEALLLDLTHEGFSAFQFYYVAPAIIATRPQFAIVEVNLRTFAPDWYGNVGLRTPQLTAQLPIGKAFRVRAALATQALGPFAPWIYFAQQLSGTLFLSDGIRQQINDVTQLLGTRINTVARSEVRSTQEQFRHRLLPISLTPEIAREWYDREFVTSPTAEMMVALIDELRNAGILTLIVLAPMQAMSLADLGLDFDMLWQRIERLRVYLGVDQEQWIHASDWVQRSDFVDAMHLHPKAVERLADVTAEHLLSSRRGEAPPRRGAVF